MIDNCLLRLLLQLRLLLGLQRGRDDVLTVHFHRDRANKRLRDYVSSSSSAAVVIDVKTKTTDGLQNFA
jgi:hypothetical protein